MGYTVLVILIIVGIVIISIVSIITSNKKLGLKLEKAFGKEPVNQAYTLDGISAYHFYAQAAANNANRIDSITWDDLDMDRVFKRINVCCTSVGEEYLYHLLHTQRFHADELRRREGLIAYLKLNEGQRLNLQLLLSRLGKKDHNGVAALINNRELKQLKYPYLYNILALLPLLGIILIPFVQSAGIVLLLSSFVVNIIVYYYSKRKIGLVATALEYFASMLWCCNKICNINDDKLKPFLADLEGHFKVFKALRSKIPTAPKNISELDILGEYIKILFLSDMRSYNKVIRSISMNLPCAQRLYECLGELDASISILSFRESLPFFCVPEFHDANTINFKGIYHPLLSFPTANDGEINNSCIITGSNASGKSTFIKAVAINGILAQTINTCAARSYSARLSLVMTSMAVRDDICQGDSYFITEIKSLKRILDKINQTPCFCFIDEILKGTNTIERIASSSAVLKYLKEKDCLCMVASHDIELTEILKHEYANYHFSERITDDGIHFDYLLKQGPSQTRNAIKLLRFMSFDDKLVQTAEDLVAKFTSTRKW